MLLIRLTHVVHTVSFAEIGICNAAIKTIDFLNDREIRKLSDSKQARSLLENAEEAASENGSLK